ncbi:Probable amidase At4g34880 [Linum grandiflorum]
MTSTYSSIFSLLLLLTLTITTNGLMPSSIKEATIDSIQNSFNQNQLTSRQLVRFYITEIERLNPVLHGVIELNPDALHQADTADHERRATVARGSRPVGGLHGIPVLLKDNIGTKDKMNTTAGSFALLGSVVARDAGKASLSEWAAFRSLKAPSGFSPRGGQGKNPYVLSAGPCGSSSGSAISVAANLVAVSIGTETDGSILCPSHSNSVVGLKPTVGLTTRSGVIPVSPRQDTIGNDPATREASKYIPRDGYKQFLRNPNRLKGLRVGVVRNPFLSNVGEYERQVFESHLKTLKQRGVITKNDEFGQDIFLAAEGTNGIGSLEKAALANLEQLTRDGFEKLMLDNYLDALVTPGPAISPILAIGGFPGINVPAGYDEKGVPFGISFGGLKGTEPKLIQLAYGFEQATMVRKPPTFLA